MQFFAILFSLLKAIPVIDKWVELFVLNYLGWKKSRLIEINKKIIKESLELKDQRKLEDEERSGRNSGLGTVVESLPRLRIKKQD